MRSSKKFYTRINAILIGIIILLSTGLVFWSSSILMQTVENDDSLFVIKVLIVSLLLLILGLIALLIKSVFRKPTEEIHALLKRFRDEAGFMHHSSDEAVEISAALDEMMDELHDLLQSVQAKTQVIDSDVETLANGIHQVTADQTNLFTLSAAIESVRSQQDGFSVITGEVLALVERTGHLAGEIRNMANQLRVEVNEVITELEHALRRVDHCRADAPMAACASAAPEETDRIEP